MSDSIFNAFLVFDLVPTFDLNLQDLEKLYFKKQKEHHPDTSPHASSEDLTWATLAAARVNDAHDVLRCPLKRAVNLLELNHQPNPLKETRCIQEPDLLVDVMGWQETLHEAETSDQINAIRVEMDRLIEESSSALSEAFAQKKFEDAKAGVCRLSYLMKIDRECQNRLREVA